MKLEQTFANLNFTGIIPLMAVISVTDITEMDFKLKRMVIQNADNDTNKRTTKSSGQNEITAESRAGKRASHGEFSFDRTIGFIEDMLIDEHFHDLQRSFLDKYWQEFTDSEENKHSYMNIFMEYGGSHSEAEIVIICRPNLSSLVRVFKNSLKEVTSQIEKFIEKYLHTSIPDFVMDDFIAELERRKSDLEGEVFEVLFTLTDFKAFKEMFLDYRLIKEGKGVDFSESLYVSSIP